MVKPKTKSNSSASSSISQSHGNSTRTAGSSNNTINITSRRRLPKPAIKKPIVSNPAEMLDVIEISSDEERDSPRKTASKKRKRSSSPDERTQDNARKLIKTNSRTSTNPISAIPSHLTKMRTVSQELKDTKSKMAVREQSQNSKEQQEWLKHKAKLDATIQDVNSVQKEIDKIKESISSLDDEISCEICMKRMWRPFTLPRCGHTFCESCLKEWFSATYKTHAEKYPELSRPPPSTIEMTDPDRILEATLRYLEEKYRHRLIPRPPFTCPTCRMKVRERPVEVFQLKALVRKVAFTLDGERSPKTTDSYASRVWYGFPGVESVDKR